MPKDSDLQPILTAFQAKAGLTGLDHEFKYRGDGDALVIYVAHPSERLFSALDSIIEAMPTPEKYRGRVLLSKRRTTRGLQSPEIKLLQTTIAGSLNVNKYTFAEDFFSRYTKSVSGAEQQITSPANNVVFGRRGAGKSSLLLYALHCRSREGKASAWVDMQVYQGRSDNKVIVEVFWDIVQQAQTLFTQSSLDEVEVQQSLKNLRANVNLNDDEIRLILPSIRRLFAKAAEKGHNFVVFLDDFHVLARDLQPKLLGHLYGVSRGNRVYLKLSAIETLTRTWDLHSHTGLEIPQDATTIKLDYNLTIPDKASQHITSILDAHAQYSGLASVRSICTNEDVLRRLVWVSAGVPRDALSIFAQAITKGALAGQKRVSITNINVAASETVSQKLRDLDVDAPNSQRSGLQEAMEAIKEFCVKKSKINAFLVKIASEDDLYKTTLELIDLRLLHVISEGISVKEAGRKYLALILDYGFYTGIRAAQSVDLFNKDMGRISYKELRRLPILSKL